MPDIDLDFPDNKREQILWYVNQKYGKDHVAQIATFGTFAAKMSIRDAGRVFGLSTQELKVWASAIPSGVGMTLKQALKESPKLKELINQDQKNQLIYETAVKIEGLPRHVSTHAAGVVISDKPLVESVPLQKGSSDLSLTQFTMGDVEKVGLLKMDFLGLKNLTILADCINFVRFGKETAQINLSSIPLNDKKTLAFFQRGDTNGIFQFESDGIKRVLRRMAPTHVEDVIAVNALYRPGPMEQIDIFIKRKKGEEPITYPHDDLKEILEVTYGVMVYQEQVMKVASQLAGYSLAEADMLRRAISKKIKAEIDAGRKQFVAGAKQKGYQEETAEQVYNYIERFANYGFNRSHSVAYSMVAYQLAYFKAHHPAAFYAALMKSSSNNKAKLREYVLEAKKRGVSVKGPDINQSEFSFALKRGDIQFGLNTIKGLRRDFIQNIWEERKREGLYQDLVDFLQRIEMKWRKDTYIRPLLYAGAFDHLGENRGTYLRSLDSVLESVKMSNGNTELFEMFAPRVEEMEDIPIEKKLEQEFEVTGFYFSGHPSEQYDHLRAPYKISYVADAKENRTMRFLGVIKGIKKIQTKKGEPMSFVEIADDSASCSLTLFPKQHRKFIKLFERGETIMVEGKVEKAGEEPKVIVRKATSVEGLAEETPKHTLFLKFDSIKKQADAFKKIQAILKESKGHVPVVVYESDTDERHRLKPVYFMDGTKECVKALQEHLGEENVVLK
jgi:DNA polymerase-3 subunit alpha